MDKLLKYNDLPRGLTSYDLLKALAILLMIVDHIGHFIYPDEIWLRVAGRLCVPIWFFLIGFSKTRDIPFYILFAGGALWVSQLAAGQYVFPVNILFALMAARISIDWILVRALRNYEAFAGMFFFLFLLSFPTMLFFEYGTLGFLFTLMGGLVRHKDAITVRPLALHGFIAACFAVFVFTQSLLLPSLSAAQFITMFAGMIPIYAMLYFFKPAEYKSFTVKRFPPVAVLQFMGRRTLELYVGHLLILRLWAMAQHPDQYAFFDFDVFALKSVLEFFI